MTAELDPFGEGAGKSPALSFKDKPTGTSYTITVTEQPNVTQSRDYETNEPAVWDDGNPKMAAVINGVLDTGEPVSVWSITWGKGKGDTRYKAIADAQAAAGAKIAPGGRLTITYTGDKPNERNPKLNAAKQYSATYSPPDVFSESPATTAAPVAQSSVDRYPGASEALAARLAADNVAPEAAAAITALTAAQRISLGYPA